MKNLLLVLVLLISININAIDRLNIIRDRIVEFDKGTLIDENRVLIQNDKEETMCFFNNDGLCIKTISKATLCEGSDYIFYLIGLKSTDVEVLKFQQLRKTKGKKYIVSIDIKKEFNKYIIIEEIIEFIK